MSLNLDNSIINKIEKLNKIDKRIDLIVSSNLQNNSHLKQYIKNLRQHHYKFSINTNIECKNVNILFPELSPC